MTVSSNHIITGVLIFVFFLSIAVLENMPLSRWFRFVWFALLGALFIALRIW